MDHCRLRLSLMGALFAAAAICPMVSRAEGDDSYKPVKADYLRVNLSKFWATGFTFLDAVNGPLTSERLKSGDKTYLRFDAKDIGPCYADSALGAKLDLIKAGGDFVFTATVLHREKSFFSFGSTPQYFVAIMDITPAIGGVAGLPEQMTGFLLPTNSPDARVLANMGELLVGLQTDIAAAAHDRGITVADMLDAGGTNRAAAEQIVTAGLNSLAGQMNVNVQDVLGQFVLALLAGRTQSAPTAAQPHPAPAPAPEMKADVVVSKPSAPPVAVPPPSEPVSVEKPDSMPVAAVDDTAAKARAEKLAKAEKERLAKEKAVADRKAKDDMERAAAEKAKADEAARAEAKRLAKEKADQEKKAKAEQARLERERVAAEEKAAEAKAEREEAERAAAAKAEKARIAAEKKAAAEKADREEAARKSAEQAEKDRVAAEKKAQEAASSTEAAANRPKLRAGAVPEAVPAPKGSDVKATTPSAKIKPEAPKPATPAPEGDDPNAPVPL